MNLSAPLQQLVPDAVASKISIATRCATANFRWEHAVSDERADKYCAELGDVGTHKTWKAGHKKYVVSLVHVPTDLPRSAECFMEVNAQAHLNEHVDNTFLLRLESINHLSNNSLASGIVHDFWLRFFNYPKDLRKPKLSDSDEQLVIDFMAQWNAQRTEARPLFATFLNDFSGGNINELVKSDWPHILRDRLGLTHLTGTAGKPHPVALMCYTVDDVRQARSAAIKKGAVTSFTRPTVLDAEFSSAFLPGPLPPGGESYGYTLDLANAGIPDTFTPELLTFPINYQRGHIKALGYITSEHALQDDKDILAARNRHVQGVQRLPDFSGFGQVLA